MNNPLPITTPLPRGLRGLNAGIAAFMVGLKLVLPGGGLFRYAIAPVLIAGVLLVGLAVGAFLLTKDLLVDWLTSLDFAPWLSWVGGILAFVLALVIAYLLFTPVMTLFGPLFMDPICERVHLRYTGNELIGNRSAQGFIKRQLYAVVQSIKWLFVTLLIEIPLALFALLTGVGAFVAVPISSIIQGADLMDTPLALRHYNLSQKTKWIRANLAAATGLGGAASVALLIPVLNLFVIPAGVAGATILMLAADGATSAHPNADGPSRNGTAPPPGSPYR
jgi:CysZ protein